jgi:hypothetical protein
MSLIETINRYTNSRNIVVAFFLLYLFATIGFWKKYEYNPTSMINFGEEFAKQNRDDVPKGAVVVKGYEGDLGAGYDGQIFYYYSRTISKLSNRWPEGFDESYRAPRIGYPLLIAIFGFAGKHFAVFGMYFVNLSLFILSVFALKRLLEPQNQYLIWLYILSPFSLGSYSVLVSDSVMVSLVVLSYYFFQKEKYQYFIPLASLSILTKEPSLFLFFPLGVYSFIVSVYAKFFVKEQFTKEEQISIHKEWKRVFVILSILFIPFLWHTYLKITFPNWRPNRLLDFILPLEGIITYGKEIYTGITSGLSAKEIVRLLSRLPLLVLLFIGIICTFSGLFSKERSIVNKGKNYVFRLALTLTFFMILSAGHYHFWSVYDNVSRMFTLSIPLIILLKQEDETVSIGGYSLVSIVIFFLFYIKIYLIQKPQPYLIW